MMSGLLPLSVDDNVRRMFRDGPILMRMSSMWGFQVSLASRVSPRYFVLLVMGMGLLLQARVASMILNGRSEKTTVDDLWAEMER